MHKKFKHHALAPSIAAISATGLITACGGGSAVGPGVYDSQLAFDTAKYTTITVTLDGVSTPVRWYREVCYVGKPMALAPTQQAGAVDNQACGYQNMNIFVREVDAAKQDSAILLNVNNAGWFASYQGGKGGWNGTDAITSSNYAGADIVNGGTYVSTSDTDKRGGCAGPRFRLCQYGLAQPWRDGPYRRVRRRHLPGQGTRRHRRCQGGGALPAPE